MDGDKIDVKFAEWVKHTRIERRLTQPEFAKKCGISRSTVANIEANKQHVSLMTFCKIAEGLGVNPSSVLDGLCDYSTETSKLSRETEALRKRIAIFLDEML